MSNLIGNYSIWKLLVRTAHVYRQYFLHILCLSALFLLPVSVLHDLIEFTFPHERALNIGADLLSNFILYFYFFVAVGEISEACLGGYMSVDKALLRVSVRGVGKYVGTEILGLFYILLAMLLSALVSGVVILSVQFLGDGVSLGSILLAIALYLSILVYLVSRVLYIAPVAALERQYWFRAIKRSFQISGRTKARSLAVAAGVTIYQHLMILIIMIPLLVLGIIDISEFGYLLLPFKLADSSVAPFDWTQLGANLYGSVVYTILIPAWVILVTLAYYSARIQSEDMTVDELVDIKTFEAV